MSSAGLRLPLTALSEDEVMLQETVRRFAREQVAPHVLAMDEAAKMRPELVRACFESGLMGIETPSELQGAGMSFFSSVIVIEELARVDPAVSVMVDVQNTLANVGILKWGTTEQKARWLPRLATDTVASFCLSEWGSGSDAFALQTRATDKGDHWELSGSKAWITNSGEAGLFVVFATTDPALGYKGISAFVVDNRATPGLTVQKPENKLGIRASSTCEVTLEGVRVPKENVLGPLGKGYKIAIESLNEGRIGIGAQMVGLAQGALDIMIPYVEGRKQFGQRIADFQGMQFLVARAAMEVETARLLVYNAARLKDSGKPFLKEAAMAKVSHVLFKYDGWWVMVAMLHSSNDLSASFSSTRPRWPSELRPPPLKPWVAWALSRRVVQKSYFATPRLGKSTKARRIFACRQLPKPSLARTKLFIHLSPSLDLFGAFSLPSSSWSPLVMDFNASWIEASSKSTGKSPNRLLT